MRKVSEQLVTQTQLELIYTGWGVTANIPKKKTKEIVCWPNKESAEITMTDLKSEYGERLFKIEFFVH